MDRPIELPPLRDLGPGLTDIPFWRLAITLTLPFLWFAAYFAFASLGWWPLAVLSLMALSFVTYGSVSHDLVHDNLGLPRRTNDILLCLVELLALRSGHAYQLAHLHHHARYPHDDDIESTAARRSFLGALAEGFVFQPRIWLWAWRTGKARPWVIGEGMACLLLIGLAIGLTAWTPIFAIYAALMIAGSWVIPLVTSYVPHDPQGANELFQTRVFRGWMASVLAVEHLYHLEHHLYPAVPRHHWPRLAKLLDPYFARAGVRPIKFWF